MVKPFPVGKIAEKAVSPFLLIRHSKYGAILSKTPIDCFFAHWGCTLP